MPITDYSHCALTQVTQFWSFPFPNWHTCDVYYFACKSKKMHGLAFKKVSTVNHVDMCYKCKAADLHMTWICHHLNETFVVILAQQQLGKAEFAWRMSYSNHKEAKQVLIRAFGESSTEFKLKLLSVSMQMSCQHHCQFILVSDMDYIQKQTQSSAQNKSDISKHLELSINIFSVSKTFFLALVLQSLVYCHIYIYYMTCVIPTCIFCFVA